MIRGTTDKLYRKTPAVINCRRRIPVFLRHICGQAGYRQQRIKEKRGKKNEIQTMYRYT